MYLAGVSSPPGRRHHRSLVGRASQSQHGQRVESEDLHADRSLAQSTDRRVSTPYVLPGRHLAEAILGRRGEDGGGAGGDRRAGRRASRDPGGGRRPQGRHRELAELSPAFERSRKFDQASPSHRKLWQFTCLIELGIVVSSRNRYSSTCLKQSAPLTADGPPIAHMASNFAAGADS